MLSFYFHSVKYVQINTKAVRSTSPSLRRMTLRSRYYTRAQITIGQLLSPLKKTVTNPVSSACFSLQTTCLISNICSNVNKRTHLNTSFIVSRPIHHHSDTTTDIAKRRRAYRNSRRSSLKTENISIALANVSELENKYELHNRRYHLIVLEPNDDETQPFKWIIFIKFELNNIDIFWVSQFWEVIRISTR